MEDVAGSIDRLKLGIDQIATSPLARARETFEIVAEVLRGKRLSRSGTN
jgi:phosphohistidine phosphatase SixA